MTRKEKEARLIALTESVWRGNECDADFEEMRDLEHELEMKWLPADGHFTPTNPRRIGDKTPR